MLKNDISGAYMAEYSNEFLKKTIKVWQPYSSDRLSLEDAREIAESMTGLFKFLMELERKYGGKKKA